MFDNCCFFLSSRLAGMVASINLKYSSKFWWGGGDGVRIVELMFVCLRRVVTLLRRDCKFI